MNDLIKRYEECEAAAMGDFYGAAPDDVAREMGIRVADVNGALLLSVSAVDILAFNRVLAIGVTRPATPDMIDDITGVYESAGVRRFFIQVSPTAKPKEITGWLEERGFSHYNNWVRLHRSTADIPEVEANLEVREIGPDEAGTFGRIVVESFEWPQAMGKVIAVAVGRPGWHHYMAYDGETPAATAAFFASGDVAWIDFAATLPQYRGRGAQKALVARRFEDAAAAGCRSVIVETGEPKPGKETPSYDNMLKMGFEVAYLRPNYLRILSGE